MTLSNTLRTLVTLTDTVETAGGTVTGLSIDPGDDEVAVDVSIRLPADGQDPSLGALIGSNVPAADSSDGPTRTVDGGTATSTAPTPANDEPDGGVDLDEDSGTGTRPANPPGPSRVDVPDRPVETRPPEPTVADLDGTTVAAGERPVERPENPDASQSARPTGDADADDRTDTSERPTATDAGGVPCREADCKEVFDSEHGMRIHFTKRHATGTTEESASGTRPAYTDPDALREAYEAHGTFAEMRDALDADVTAATVRRHAIKHGIHEVSGHDDDTSDEKTAGGTDEAKAPDSGEPEEPEATDSGTDEVDAAGPGAPDRDDAVLASDVELPAGVDAPEFVEAVQSAHTVYDVARELDCDRALARDLLDRLDVLDLVQGRMATKPRRDEMKAEIETRLRERAGD